MYHPIYDDIDVFVANADGSHIYEVLVAAAVNYPEDLTLSLTLNLLDDVKMASN
jgi:hypothetical protein